MACRDFGGLDFRIYNWISKLWTEFPIRFLIFRSTFISLDCSHESVSSRLWFRFLKFQGGFLDNWIAVGSE